MFPLGKIERWLLLYGKNEFKIVGNVPENEIPKRLKLEGFFESENGVSIEFHTWEERIQVNPENITVIMHGKSYLETYLGLDVVPPNTAPSGLPDLPRVSLVTPVYNSERFFDNYIRQIKAIKYPKDLLEVVVVDDGSSDAVVVKDFSKRIRDIVPNTRLIRNRENMGVFYSKMMGTKVSSGEYVTYWDIDDEYDPYQILLLAIHTVLLKKKQTNFLLSVPNILMSPEGELLGFWKTRYEKATRLVVRSLLTFSGKVPITSTLLVREHVLKTYRILMEKYEVLKITPKLSVPEDTILANQMILEGYVETVYPISYTGRGHVRYQKNTSANLERRTKEVPLATVVGLIKLKEIAGLEKVLDIVNKYSDRIVESIMYYFRYSKKFAENFIRYLEIYGENELRDAFLKILKEVME